MAAKPKIAVGLSYIGLGVLFLLAVALYLLGSGHEVEGHRERRATLLQLKELDAHLDQHALLLGHFLNGRDAALTTTLARVEALRADALSLFGERFPLHHGGIQLPIREALREFDLKVQLLGQMQQETRKEEDEHDDVREIEKAVRTRDPALADRIAKLLFLLHVYHTHERGSEELEHGLLHAMENLAPDPDADELTRSQLQRLKELVTGDMESMKRLESLRQRYMTLSAGQDRALDSMFALYGQHVADDYTQSRRISFALMVLAAVFLSSLAYAFFRLHATWREAELERRMWQDGVESLQESFALFDADGTLRIHNRRFLELYPSLAPRIASGVTREQTLQIAEQRKPVLLNSSPTDGNFEERLPGGVWVLANDTRTQTGGYVQARLDVTAKRRAEMKAEQLSQVVEQSPSTVVITDPAGSIQYVNRRFTETTGYSEEEAIGQNPRILKSGDKSVSDYQNLWETITGGGCWRGQFLNRSKYGNEYWESVAIFPIHDSAGEIVNYAAVKEEITARKLAEAQLSLNQRVFELAREGILVTDAEARIKSVNPAFIQITGYRPEHIIGQNPRILASGRHDRDFFRQMWKQLERSGQWSGEVWNRNHQGEFFPVWLSVAAVEDEHSRVREYVGIFSDLSQHKRLEERVEHHANHDSLTGLPNRDLFIDRLAQTVALARREHAQVAVLLVDLDRFNGVNDIHGHLVGDEVLQEAARRLGKSVRASDTIARLGSDEFGLIIGHTNGYIPAAEVAEKVLENLGSKFVVGELELYLTASIGITLFPNDSSSLAEILQNADMALKRVKETGHNHFEFFVPAMNERVRERSMLERELRAAMDAEQLQVHYQPLVSLAGQGVTGVEALLRWEHPELGPISPARFIPLAEETGLIEPLGRWVLRRACHQLADWDRGGLDPMTMSVNVSTRQFELGFNAQEVDQLLSESGIDGKRLSLEITESVMLEGDYAALKWLGEFKKLGVRVSIDDFGTGYSSLSYLKRFPVDTLKVDRAFISELPGSPKDQSLIESILAMAKALNLQVVAEGVETREQAAFLSRYGCDLAQGFLYSRAVPGEQLPALARQIAAGSPTKA